MGKRLLNSYGRLMGRTFELVDVFPATLSWFVCYGLRCLIFKVSGLKVYYKDNGELIHSVDVFDM